MGSSLSFLGIMLDSDEIDLKLRLSHFLFGHDQVTFIRSNWVLGQVSLLSGCLGSVQLAQNCYVVNGQLILVPFGCV